MTSIKRIISITHPQKQYRRLLITQHIKRPYTLQTQGSTTNIIIPARVQKNKMTLTAHYDVYQGSKGYNDNSSGVVALLNIHDLVPDNVEIVFTDFEEFGGIGCELYLNLSKIKPKQAINVDVVGLGNKLFYESYVGGISSKIPESLEYYKNVPFSDSYIFRNFNIPNILLLSGTKKETLISDIFNAQHNGPHDGDLSYISNEMIDFTSKTILNLVENQERKDVYKNENTEWFCFK